MVDSIKTQVEMVLTFASGRTVRLEPCANGNIIVRQAGSILYLPKNELAEFCRKLQEWAAQHG